MHEQVVGLVVEAPLAEDDVGARVLDLVDHVHEVLLLHVAELVVVLDRLDLEAVLGLGLGGLEGAGQNADLGVLHLLHHLGVREVLVQHDSLDELAVGEGASGLCHNFDQVEVHVLPLDVGHVEHRLHGQVGEVVLALADDLGAQGGHGALSEVVVAILGDVDLLLDAVQLVHGDVASLLESVGDLQGVDALVEQLLGLLEDGAGKDHHSGRAVSNLVVLRSGQLDKEFGGLVVDLHLLEDGGTIIGDDDIAVGTDQHLVHALGTEGGLEEGGDGPGGQDVDLMGLEALDPLLLLLLPEDDERAP
mmetsp:Transcript_1006/g.1808  ORF Transcript_1006/g.1808 Transcript_1006/m.1808 type:complete len:305 (+) Transcript_1006:748-1662(+)